MKIPHTRARRMYLEPQMLMLGKRDEKGKKRTEGQNNIKESRQNRKKQKQKLLK